MAMTTVMIAVMEMETVMVMEMEMEMVMVMIWGTVMAMVGGTEMITVTVMVMAGGTVMVMVTVGVTVMVTEISNGGNLGFLYLAALRHAEMDSLVLYSSRIDSALIPWGGMMTGPDIDHAPLAGRECRSKTRAQQEAQARIRQLDAGVVA